MRVCRSDDIFIYLMLELPDFMPAVLKSSENEPLQDIEVDESVDETLDEHLTRL